MEDEPASHRNHSSAAGDGGLAPSNAVPLAVMTLAMTATALVLSMAVLLLCYSHMEYRRRMGHPGRVSAAAMADDGIVDAADEGRSAMSTSPEDSKDVLLVLFPGEKSARACACASPLEDRSDTHVQERVQEHLAL